MPQLPSQFVDGDILFAAPMELIRDFLENSLGYKATASGQILISTAAGDQAGDNTEVLQIPQTGTGILYFTNGTPTVEAVEAGVLTSDSNDFPFSKLPLHDWTQDTSSGIPASALPGAQGISLTSLWSQTDYTMSNTTYVWRPSGYTFGASPPALLAIRFNFDSTYVSSTTSLSDLVFFLYDDLPEKETDTTALPGEEDNAVVVAYDLNVTGERSRLYLAKSSSDQLLVAGFASRTTDYVFDKIDLWEVTNATIEGRLLPDLATRAEAEAGNEVEERMWSPLRVRQAAEQVTEDEEARIAQNETDIATNTADIAQLETDLAAKQDSATLTDQIEDFAIVGNTGEIPTTRYGDDTVTESKLSPQVRDKLAIKVSGGGGGSGTAFYSGTADPSSSLGDTGAHYFQDVDPGVLWARGSTGWAVLYTFTDEDTTVTYGSAAPDDADGDNGDSYLRTSDPAEWYVKAGGTWSNVHTFSGGGGSGDTLHYGSDAPASSLGENGDEYLRTGVTPPQLYHKASGSWTSVYTWPADTGNTTYSGSSAPSSSLGVANDYYFRTSSPPQLYVKGSSAWSSIYTWTELNNELFHGSTAPAAATGDVGDYYLRTTTPPQLYEKTASDTWTSRYTWQERSADVRYGPSAPDDADGANHDYYFRTSDPPQLYRKVSNSWTSIFTWDNVADWAKVGDTSRVPLAKLAGGTATLGYVPALHSVNNNLIAQWTQLNGGFISGSGEPTTADGQSGSHYLRTSDPPEYWHRSGDTWTKVYTWPLEGDDLLYGSSAPASSLGDNGDNYLRTSSPPQLYNKASGTWSSIYTWPSAGNDLLTGSAEPASGLGDNGDFYFRTSDPPRMYLKASGSWSVIYTWHTTVNDIHHGSGVPAASLGDNGDYYLRTTDPAQLYEKASGAWTSIYTWTTWRFGTSIPDDSLGINGDLYLRTVSGTNPPQLFEKQSGSWASVFTWHTANQLLHGSDEPDGADGLSNDYYFRTTDPPELLFKLQGAWANVFTWGDDNHFYSGSDAPDNDDGARGDYYLRTSDPPVLWVKGQSTWTEHFTFPQGGGSGSDDGNPWRGTYDSATTDYIVGDMVIHAFAVGGQPSLNEIFVCVNATNANANEPSLESGSGWRLITEDAHFRGTPTGTETYHAGDTVLLEDHFYIYTGTVTAFDPDFIPGNANWHLIDLHGSQEEFEDAVAEMWDTESAVDYNDTTGKLTIDFPDDSNVAAVEVALSLSGQQTNRSGSAIANSFTLDDVVGGEAIQFYANYEITTTSSGRDIGNIQLAVSDTGGVGDSFGEFIGAQHNGSALREIGDQRPAPFDSVQDNTVDGGVYFSHTTASSRTLYLYRPVDANADDTVRFNLDIYAIRVRASNNRLLPTTAGNDGQVLTSTGVLGEAQWETPSGGGGGTSQYEDLDGQPFVVEEPGATGTAIVTPDADNDEQLLLRGRLGARTIYENIIDFGHDAAMTFTALTSAVLRTASGESTVNYRGVIHSHHDLPPSSEATAGDAYFLRNDGRFRWRNQDAWQPLEVDDLIEDVFVDEEHAEAAIATLFGGSSGNDGDADGWLVAFGAEGDANDITVYSISSYTAPTSDTYSWIDYLYGLKTQLYNFISRIPSWVTTTSEDVPEAKIPDLGADKITSGEFDVDRIPDLPAGQITSGQLGAGRIPNLDATKITTGTFNTARLASGGTDDQVLTRTASGMAWEDAQGGGSGVSAYADLTGEPFVVEAAGGTAVDADADNDDQLLLRGLQGARQIFRNIVGAGHNSTMTLSLLTDLALQAAANDSDLVYRGVVSNEHQLPASGETDEVRFVRAEHQFRHWTGFVWEVQAVDNLVHGNYTNADHAKQAVTTAAGGTTSSDGDADGWIVIHGSDSHPSSTFAYFVSSYVAPTTASYVWQDYLFSLKTQIHTLADSIPTWVTDDTEDVPVAQIPDLPASQITSGTLGTARLASGGSDDDVLTRTSTGMAWETPTSSGITQTAADARYVLETGDTMTGSLVIERSGDNTGFDVETVDVNSKPAFFLRVGTGSGQKGFQAGREGQNTAWASFEGRLGGDNSKPGIAFGPGTSGRDVNLYRDGSNLLKTDDTFEANALVLNTDLPITHGGTGSSTASAARSALGTNNAANLTTGTVAEARLPNRPGSAIEWTSMTQDEYDALGSVDSDRLYIIVG